MVARAGFSFLYIPYALWYRPQLAYGTCIVVVGPRLIVIWWVPWYPIPCRHGTLGTIPSTNGHRHRPMYHRAVANGQWPILVVPGNYLHAGMISLCSIIGTMIRSPKSASWKGQLGLLSLGNSIIKLASS